ncbi:AAA family ATPase [Klebsiella pneumoniae]|uniref:AAA family ATPase n=1 Tax=Klebsiella pneumoniae TaxID=573 RepID=UPI0011440A70|nr:AAA family ATPase [Klebsiella pneumoniae]MBD7325794.1 ATP-binding protein [Klebsiella pneumoniae]MBD7342145.1 ATP-binding protein [Klebsiella pneumoniae]MCB7664327.1 ATP-binding protein [Klebsiella pneumoniae]TYY87213.1 ATP-binding protein [Klebsiella pneumoniae]CAE7107794.1 hypothetical protein AI2693V1_2922 [Klebsiella pneumoniae]
MLEIENLNPFSLAITPIKFNTQLSLLVGTNGCGKSRFLQSLKLDGSSCIIDGKKIPSSQIVYLSPGDMSFGSIQEKNSFHDINEHQSNSLYELYKRYSGGDGIIENLAPSKRNPDDKDYDFESLGVNRDEFVKRLQIVSYTVEKDIDNLSKDDLESFYRTNNRGLFSLQDITSEFHFYITKMNEALYNEWLKETQQIENKKISPKTFKKLYDKEPWVVFNDILRSAFEGKYSISFPTSHVDKGYIPVLLLNEKISIEMNNLSSGEKVMMSFVIAVFSCLYKAKRITTSEIKILLLDEPDAHLHPKMLKTLHSFLEQIIEEFECYIIIATHSPTTAALAREKSIYLLDNNLISAISKYNAVNSLMDGISSIQLNVENRRQVLVESSYDNDIYQEAFDFLVRKNIIGSDIHLDFVSSGPKIDDELIKSKLSQFIAKDIDSEKIEAFIKGINGVGSCTHIFSQVTSFHKRGQNNIRGLVDWDKENKDGNGIIVFAPDTSYAIENILLDPIALKIQLYQIDNRKFQLLNSAGEKVDLGSWLENPDSLQNEVDMFMLDMLESPNNNDTEIHYMNGMIIKSDSRYLKTKGHNWNEKINKKYPCLRKLTNGQFETLKFHLLKKSMIDATRGDLLPIYFKEAFERLIKLG